MPNGVHLFIYLQSRLASAASGTRQSLDHAASLIAAADKLQATIPEDPNEGGPRLAHTSGRPVCFSSKQRVLNAVYDFATLSVTCFPGAC